MAQTANTVNFTFTGTDLVSRVMSAVAGSTNKLGTQIRKAEADIEAFNRKSKALNTTLTGLVSTSGFMSTIMAGFSVTNFVTANAEFENMSAKLNVLVKDYASAGQYFKEIQTFAKETPYTIEQTTMAYIKLVSRGLRPSVETLRSMGDIASVLGTRLEGARGGIMQVVEAVADLVVGQTRRFEELGVSVAQTKNEVTFYFDGVYTKVKKDTNDLVDFVTAVIGGKFAGAMESQMQTIGGKWSNLSDSIQIAFYNIGKSGFNAELKRTIDLFTQAVNSMSEGSKELSALISLPLKVLNIGLELAINNVGLLSVALSGFIAKNIIGTIGGKFAAVLAGTAERYKALSKLMTTPVVIPVMTGSSVVAGRVAGTAASKTSAIANTATSAIADAYVLKSAQTNKADWERVKAAEAAAFAQKNLNKNMAAFPWLLSRHENALRAAVVETRAIEASLAATTVASTSWGSRLALLGSNLLKFTSYATYAGLAVGALTAAYLTFRAFYKTDEEKADAKINKAIKDAETFNALSAFYKKISARKIIDQTDTNTGTKGEVTQYGEEAYQRTIKQLAILMGMKETDFFVDVKHGAERIQIVEKLIQKELELQKIIKSAQKEKESLSLREMEKRAAELDAKMKAGGEWTGGDGFASTYFEYTTDMLGNMSREYTGLINEIDKYNAATKAGMSVSEVDALSESYKQLSASYMKSSPSGADIGTIDRYIESLKKQKKSVEEINVAESLRSVIIEKSTDPVMVINRELQKQLDTTKYLPEEQRMLNEYLEKGRILLINNSQAAGDTVEEFKKTATAVENANKPVAEMYNLITKSVKAIEEMRLSKAYSSIMTDLDTKLKEADAKLKEAVSGEPSDEEMAKTKSLAALNAEYAEADRNSYEYYTRLANINNAYEQLLGKERAYKNQIEENNKAEAERVEQLRKEEAYLDKVSRAQERYGEKISTYSKDLEERKNQALKNLGGDSTKESSIVGFSRDLTDLAVDAHKTALEVTAEVNKVITDTLDTESLERQAEAFKKFEEQSSSLTSWMDQLQESVGDSSNITKQFNKQISSMTEELKRLAAEGNVEQTFDILDEMAKAEDRFSKIKLASYNAGIDDLIESIKLEGEYTGKTRVEIARLDAVKKAKVIGDKYNLEVSQATIDKLKEEIAETERLKKSYDTYQAGMRVGLQTVIDDSTEKTQSMAKLITESFSKAEDALVNFVKTGKLQLKDMFSFIAESLLRMQLKQNIITPIATMMQGFLPGLGSLSGAATGSSVSGGMEIGSMMPGSNKVNRPSAFGSLIPAAKYNNNASAAVPFNQTVVIDARGADKGVEERIKAAMEQNKRETIAKIQELNNRGGSFARNSGRYRD